MMADPRLKTIKIQTGVVRRLAKEKLSYEKEAEIQRNKNQKYKDEGQEEAYLKKQEEVLQESIAMIYDSQRRLLKSYNELKLIIESPDNDDLKENDDFIKAKEVMEEAKAQLPQ